MKVRSIVLGACAVGGVLLGSMLVPPHAALAQSCMTTTGFDFTGFFLRIPWNEVEGDWVGDWRHSLSPLARGPGSFSADFKKGSERASADLTVSFNGNAVHILRVDPHGTCDYNGTVQSGTAFISGNYRCSWNPPRASLPFTARMGNGLIPKSMCSGAPDPRLTTTWHLTEGDWSGTWFPINGRGSGQFRSLMRKGLETSEDGVQLTLDGNAVSGFRVVPKGVCSYTGSIAADGLHASGTMTCPWDINLGGHLQRRPWNAVIGT